MLESELSTLAAAQTNNRNKTLTGHSEGFWYTVLQSRDRNGEFNLPIEKLKLYQDQFWVYFRMLGRHFEASFAFKIYFYTFTC